MMYKKSPGTCCTADGIKGIAAGSMAGNQHLLTTNFSASRDKQEVTEFWTELGNASWLMGTL